MFVNFLKSFGVSVALLPSAAAFCYGLLEAANKTGFGEKYHLSHLKLTNFLNYLIYILIEHAIWYLFFCALVAFIWTLIIAEPKAKSKRSFDVRRRKLRR